MASERIRRQIDRFLDEAEEAASKSQWPWVRDRAENVLAFDPDNADAKAFLAAANLRLANVSGSDDAIDVGAQGAVPSASQTATPASGDQNSSPVPAPSAVNVEGPTAFANGRYTVKRFLGEGGKKKVYLAHDTLLDRDVAFALIKTKSLDEAAREASHARLRPWAAWAIIHTS